MDISKDNKRVHVLRGMNTVSREATLSTLILLPSEKGSAHMCKRETSSVKKALCSVRTVKALYKRNVRGRYIAKASCLQIVKQIDKFRQQVVTVVM